MHRALHIEGDCADLKHKSGRLQPNSVWPSQRQPLGELCARGQSDSGCRGHKSCPEADRLLCSEIVPPANRPLVTLLDIALPIRNIADAAPWDECSPAGWRSSVLTSSRLIQGPREWKSDYQGFSSNEDKSRLDALLKCGCMAAMKTKILFTLAGALLAVTGCVSTVSG